VRKVKRQTQKVKATVQNVKVRGPQIGHGPIPCGIGVKPLQLVGLDSLQFLVEIGKRAPIFAASVASMARTIITMSNAAPRWRRVWREKRNNKKDRPSGKPKSTSQTVKFLFESISLPK
jgi:hypothetical protein